MSIGAIVGCSSYLSGGRLKRAAKHRTEEIDSISNALGDMSSVDYAVKTMMLSGVAMNKEGFSETLRQCRGREGEASLLFDMLDATKDGFVDEDDFRCMQSFISHRRKPKSITVSLINGS